MEYIDDYIILLYDMYKKSYIPWSVRDTYIEIVLGKKLNLWFR